MRKFVVVTLVLVGTVLFSVRWILAQEADELRERAAAMKREATELLERGRKEEALDLQRGIEKLLRVADERDSKTKKLKSPAEAKQRFGETGERINHIRQAAKHLSAAGMEDMAEELRKQAIRAEEELKREFSGKEEKTRRVEGDTDDLRSDLRRLREQIEKLRSEVSELREQVKR